MAHILTVFFIASASFSLFQNQVQSAPEQKDLEDPRGDKNGVWDNSPLQSLKLLSTSLKSIRQFINVLTRTTAKIFTVTDL